MPMRDTYSFVFLLLLLTCYLPADATGVHAQANRPLDSFLASDDFEDAQPKQARQPLKQQHISAPHDVGNMAVKLPEGFGNWDVKMKSLQRKGKFETLKKNKLSLADAGVAAVRAKAGPHAKRGSFLDDEDGSPHQEFSRILEDQEPEPTLLEQVAVESEEPALFEKATESKEQELQQHTKEMELQQEQLQYQQLLESQQQEKRRVLLEIESENDDPSENVKAAERFFESQDEFGSKDTERPLAVPQTHKASYEEELADDEVLLQKPNKTVLSQVAAKVSAKKGHSMAGPYIVPPGYDYIPNVGQTGEEGEHIQNFNIPELNKLAIPVLTEEELALRQENIKDGLEIDKIENKVKAVVSQLKADTYTSAKRSTWRLEKQQEMETAVRRAQLLADANRYKAELDRQQRLKAEDVAGYERAMHLASEEVKTADKIYGKAHKELQEETASGLSVMEAQQAKLEGLQRDLQKEKDEANVLEAEAIANVTADLVAVSKPSASLSQLGEVENRTQELATDYARQHASPSAMELYETVSRAAESDPLRDPLVHYVSNNAPTHVPMLQGDHGGLSLAQEHAMLTHPQKEQQSAPPGLAASQFGSMEALATSSTLGESNCGGLGQYPCPVPLPATAQASTLVQPVPESVQAPTSVMQSHGDCHPQCTWQCDTPKCDEVCEPECSAPRCETRCSAPDVSGCLVECDEPHCAVVCPAAGCPGQTCPECQTTCSEPMCKLLCDNSQPCRNICEHPSCEWKCKAPTDCPAPVCNMVCETPQHCHGSTYQTLPPLAPGETAVSAFKAPVSLQQKSAEASTSQLRGATAQSSELNTRQIDVPVTRRIEDADSRTTKLEQEIISMPVMPRQTA